MTSQSPEKSPSRKQRLQEKQKRQLAVVDAVDKAEAKLRKAEAELAEAVAEAVEVFGSDLGASEELGLPVDTVRGYLRLVEGGADGTDGTDGAEEPGGTTEETASERSPVKAGAKAARTREATEATAATAPEPAMA
ncbi:hypothetical protein [Streptomyces sp. NRRL F-5135]|uniref:hypothetical protein n=1 Tax=Streptomyces sp. NRRL F-5135 TaxID=1463858 RepID=UPI001F236EDB|nr:hypothetical protein [Streptomyces sp. NRRL F-5135]